MTPSASNSTGAPSLLAQTREVLDFPAVKAFFAQKAQTAEGKRRILEADLLPAEHQAPFTTELDQWFTLTADGPALRFPTVPGQTFFEREASVKPFDRLELRNLRDLLDFFSRLVEDKRFTFLADDLHQGPDVIDLGLALGRLFDKDGDWSENISPLYQQLIRQYFKVDADLEASLRSLMRRYGDVLNESIVYERNHRRVLAVKVNFRGRVKGILHDYSSSGNTIYIEPEETISKQNRLREIESEIEEELWRIRVEMTERALAVPEVAQRIAPLAAHCDRMQGLALTGHACRCICLTPNHQHDLQLLEARHPFLDEHFAEQRRQHTEAEARDQNRMVPFSLHLDADVRGLVISGANTGGKTVTLKTTGLLAWMANSGFPVPLDEGSAIPFYATILADIGDNQSLSHNLSTFASHLANMRAVLSLTDPNALVLLDELGSGTDPNEGNALAQALIEEITDRGMHLMVTTHQQVLCTLAMNHETLENASMAFDTRRMRPVYRLQQGVPGRSHALEIAGEAGLPEGLLKRARTLIDEDQVDIQAAIRNLQDQHKDLHQQKRRMRREELKLHHRVKEVREEAGKLRRQQEDFKTKTRDRLSREIDKAERNLRDVLESASSKQKRTHLANFAAKRAEILEPFAKEEAKKEPSHEPSNIPKDKWAVGDRVFLPLFKQEGVIQGIERKKLRLNINGKTMTVRIDEVMHLGRAEQKVTATKVYDAVESDGPISFEFKLLGMRVEEALSEVEGALDQAMRRGNPFLRFIHGHGSGAVKGAVRDYLRRHEARDSYEVVIERENDGVTEVKFHAS